MYFDNLVGHEARIGELQRELSDGRLPHAILLSGCRGVGKRKLAESIAAAFLCQEKNASQACGRCSACVAFGGGNHPDLHLIEREAGKRDIGIAQIRELLVVLHRKSHQGLGRVAVIDEMEKMTFAGQNAFLKTLEEPPPETVLVLISSVAERILPTVRSRCAIHQVGPLCPDEMKKFVSQWKEDLSSVPLSLARGSPGDLIRLSAKDACAARDVVLEFVTRRGRVSSFEFAARLMECASLAVEEGEDDARERVRDRLGLYLNLLSSALRDVQVLAMGAEGDALIHSDRLNDLGAFARQSDPDRLAIARESCQQGMKDLRRNMDPALALEEVARTILC